MLHLATTRVDVSLKLTGPIASAGMVAALVEGLIERGMVSSFDSVKVALFGARFVPEHELLIVSKCLNQCKIDEKTAG